MQNEQGRSPPGFEVVVVFQTRHEPGVVPAAETQRPDKEVSGRNIPQRQQIAEPLVFPVSPRPSQRSNGLACDQAGQDRGQSDRQHQRGCAAQSIDQPVTREIQRGNQRDEYGNLDDRTSMEIHVATFLSPPYSPPVRREGSSGPVDGAFRDRVHRRRTRLYGEDARPSETPQTRGLAAPQQDGW